MVGYWKFFCISLYILGLCSGMQLSDLKTIEFFSGLLLSSVRWVQNSLYFRPNFVALVRQKPPEDSTHAQC